MSKPARRCGAQVRVSRLLAILACGALPLAGCSSSVERFDYPVFGYTATDGSPTGAISPNQPVYSSSPTADTYGNAQGLSVGRRYEPYQSYQETRQQTRSSTEPVAPVRQSEPLPRLRDERQLSTYSPSQQVVAAPGADGAVTVRSGDTLYSLARRNNVSVDALKNANNIQGNNIKVGERLVLPGRGTAFQVRQVAPQARAVAASGRTYKVRPGDTVYSISRRYGIRYDELAALNNLSDANEIKLGQKLKLPQGAGTTATVKSRRVAAVKTKPIRRAPSKPKVAPQKTSPKKITRLPNPEPRSQGRFRWPVRGRIISKFGPKANGSHNDGINVAVPAGTSVKAVENGVVAYAGNELKGYGNLVLIRHSDSWVSAYAHNERLLVKRGDKIKRGQIVAKSGRTGSVKQPQLHFELRRGSKPVDPMKHMAAL